MFFEISLALLSEMQGRFQIVWELNVFASIFVCGVVTHPAKTFPRRASRADFLENYTPPDFLGAHDHRELR